ncbi:hypothetical protein SAMN05661091_1116 [Paenibacillus uliginis N3/975]|uniref:Uncharacterized protein n=1 Tax=Paenibacillus uliginis N3/975 TaxID=1313296 RepID=A0A1X7GUL0_9BACL|nr:hypothetical protein SAMN05661091_1116 [Paenibacillus uliginis N3/975]
MFMFLPPEVYVEQNFKEVSACVRFMFLTQRYGMESNHLA